MAHFIKAVVGARHALLAAFGACAPLTDSLGLVALDDERIAALGAHGLPVAPFELLTAQAITAVAARLGPLEAWGYLETEDFGGEGEQRAGAWRGAAPLVPPTAEVGAVNTVLRTLGVQRAEQQDEWDAVGLSRFRSNRDLP